MSTPTRILVVEDETKLAALIDDYLRAAGYAVVHVGNGDLAARMLREEAYDLVVLDLMLPGRDGLRICRELRDYSQVPVIMVTARVDEIDRLLGLELGADDYLCKPFSPRELVARIKAVLRRYGTRAEPRPALLVDPKNHLARYNGVSLDLTPVELRLLAALQDSEGRVLSRDQLMVHLYKDRRVVADRTVDSHVKNLRRKLQAAMPGEDPIRSVYGVGYALDLP